MYKPQIGLCKRKEYGYRGMLLPLTAYVGLVFPFYIPNAISQMIKPFGIMIAIYYLVVSKRIIFKYSHKLLILYGISSFIAMIRSHSNTDFTGSISTLLYVTYAFCYLSVEHTNDSVIRLIKSSFYAGLTFSIIAAFSNPLFGTNVYNRTYLWMFTRWMNSNQVAYIAVIGLSTIPFMLLDKNGLKRHWIRYIPAYMLMVYVILLTMSRGAFLCLAMIMTIFFYDTIMKYSKKSLQYSFLLIVICLVGIIMVYKFIPDDQMNRLLSKDSYQDTSGRFDMFSVAINVVDNKIFGEGAGAWQTITGSSSKIHNIFIDVFVESGFIGLSLLIMLIVSVILNVRQINVLSIIVPMVMVATVESGDDYLFWIPFILSNLLIMKKPIY